jgi:hypothetical protein
MPRQEDLDAAVAEAIVTISGAALLMGSDARTTTA